MVEVDEKQITEDIQFMLDRIVAIDKELQQLAIRMQQIIGGVTKNV